MIQSGKFSRIPRPLGAAFLSLCRTHRLVPGPLDYPLDGGCRPASLLCPERSCAMLHVVSPSSTLQSNGSHSRLHCCIQAVPFGTYPISASDEPGRRLRSPGAAVPGAVPLLVYSACPGCSSPEGAEHLPLDIPVQGTFSVPLHSSPDVLARSFRPPSVRDVPVRVVNDPSLSFLRARGDPPPAVPSLGPLLLCAC